MRFIPATCEQRDEMLRAVGCESVDELFADVPGPALLNKELDIPHGFTEMELAAHLRSLAEANIPASRLVSFVGAGCYDHYIPSVVDHVISRPEFFTAYTPYQPEVSQGTLQAIYEYQSMICALTGMDVANASMYDGATAFVEAALMACRVTKRNKVLVLGMVNPEWLDVLGTYSDSGLFEIEATEADAATSAEQLRTLVGPDTAAILMTSPNFVGVLEDITGLAEVAHGAGALLVVGSNPILLGVIEPPGALGADIVVGEGQPLGSPMSFGGPGFGFFACRDKHVRQMPGRLVGRGVDVDGDTAYVLTLSTREQHIRREKATSNICSNHALNAMAAGVYLAAVGSEGLRSIATTSIARAHYLRDELIKTGKFTAPWELPFGNEFALVYDGDTAQMYDTMFDKGYIAGIVLETEEGEPDLVLFAVTEQRTRAQIDAFVREVQSL
ncbi:MAG: aminomethyl-transferring glycine dehydrogenase [Actinobacteria bacterium HGW-Actinobacteria-7]|jgi:glycine dehydrogenase subunit 1|nr:MAG: aminomethyl-transferring glycine dehydrogenase [Actinobacteria bacterium HGW-Actinobacteria-7]